MTGSPAAIRTDFVGAALKRKKLTEAELEAIAANYSAQVLAPWEQAYLRAHRDAEWSEEFDRMKVWREEDASEIKRSLLEPGYRSRELSIGSPSDFVQAELNQFDVDPNSSEADLIAAAVRSGINQGQRAIDRLLAGEARPRLERSVASPQNRFTIRDAVKRYLADKDLAPRTKIEVRHTLARFEAVVGNKALADLERTDFRSYIAALCGESIGGKSGGAIERPASAASVEKKVGLLRSAINHAKELDLFSGENPASGHKIDAYLKPQNKAVMPDKRPFRTAELNAIFAHPWFTGCVSSGDLHSPGSHRLTGMHYWVPIVALMTGCRAAELGGLMLNEVRIDDPHPHLRIRDNKFRRTKGSYARDVPLIDQLRELGFDAYVEAVQRTGAERLFPDWLPKKTARDREQDFAWANAPLIRAFNRTVVPAMLGDQLLEGARREVTFHSFGGAFKSMLNLRGVPFNVINEVIGHAKDELDRRYVGTIPIEETYGLVRGCTFDGLRVPSVAF